MDFGVPMLEALVRERIDDLRRQARVRALTRRPAARRRPRHRLGAACVALGRRVAGLGAALMVLGRRIGGDAVSARP